MYVRCNKFDCRGAINAIDLSSSGMTNSQTVTYLDANAWNSCGPICLPALNNTKLYQICRKNGWLDR